MIDKTPHTGLQRFLFILKVIEIRLRFVAVLVITALIVGYWGNITNYYHRWTRQAATEEKTSDKEYFCPMHPFVTRESPGKCPICNMDLQLHKKSEHVKLPEGVLTRVQVSPERIMEAGVLLDTVKLRPLTRTVRSYGNVEADETKLARLIARFPGRVEELIVNAVGIEVKKGEPLARIYSPKYLAATFEYIQALESKTRAESDPHAAAETKQLAADLAASTRKPLERQGFTAEQLDEIARSGKAADRVTFFSPMSGTVIEKNVLAGDMVEENTVLYTIADLSRLWVQVQIVESDLESVKSGMPVEVTTVARPGESFSGTVDLIYPALSIENRTVKARLSVDNKDGKLRPGMYVTAAIKAPVGTVLSIPETAVIDTGTRQLVYIESQSGVYDKHEVKLGVRVDEFYPVTGGLKAGDRIVTRGSFLIDAEARLTQSAEPESAGEKSVAEAKKKDDYPLDTCVVSGEKLGAMGEPEVLIYEGKTIKFCCPACVPKFKKDPQTYLKKLENAEKLKPPR